MTPSPPVGTAVQGWALCAAIKAAGKYNRIMVQVDGVADDLPLTNCPVVLVSLALDASGRRVISDELVERVACAVEGGDDEWLPMSESGKERRRGDVRAVLSAALLSAGSLGLEGRK